jgi:hypothetical protein
VGKTSLWKPGATRPRWSASSPSGGSMRMAQCEGRFRVRASRWRGSSSRIRMAALRSRLVNAQSTVISLMSMMTEKLNLGCGKFKTFKKFKAKNTIFQHVLKKYLKTPTKKNKNKKSNYKKEKH